MVKLRNGLYLLLAVFISLFAFSTAFGEDSRPSPVGGGIGFVLSEEPTAKNELEITKELSPQALGGANDIPILDESQLIGLYILESFMVYFDSGTVLDSQNYQFLGDMAITSHDALWQRMAISGFQTAVASGIISISGETMTIYNDLVPENSVPDISWDGTYLTTEIRVTSVADPFTEIDTWKRVLSQSDQDNDGVFNEWDDCPSTPPNSCVDNKGCPCSSATKVVVIPLF